MRSAFANLRTLTLPGGAVTGTRIVIDGVNGEIRFYNAADELIGYLSPDRWYTGLEDGAHAQLDPFGGVRIYDSNGLLAATLDAAGGLQIRDPATGLILASLGTTGLHVEDPSGAGLDLDITNGAAGNVVAPRAKISKAVTPGTTNDTPAVTQFTPVDFELRHVACWTNGVIAAQTFTPPGGYTEQFDDFLSTAGIAMHATLATRSPAVPNAIRTFTSTFGLYQFDTGIAVVVRGTPGGTAPTIRDITNGFVLDSAPADETDVLSLETPAGIVAGDLLLAFVSFGNDGGGIPSSWSVPDGWAGPIVGDFSSTGGGPSDSTLATGMWWKVADADDVAALSRDVTVISPGVATKAFHWTVVAIADPGEVGSGPDYRIGGKSLARGVVAYQHLEAGSVAYGDAAITDFVLTDVPVIAGRIYRPYLHTQFVQNTTDNWTHDFLVDGVKSGRFHVYNTAANAPGQVSGGPLWRPQVTGLVDLGVQIEQVTPIVFGDSVTYQADATAPRQFWIEDVGGDY